MFAREPLSRRTLAVIGGTAALFIVVLVLLSAQMASGHDPALSANARRAKAAKEQRAVDARAAADRAQIEAQVQAEQQAQQQYDQNYGQDGYGDGAPAQDQQQQDVQPQVQQPQQQDVQPQVQQPQVQVQPQPQQQAPLQSTTS